MAENTSGTFVEDGESVAGQGSTNISGINGKGGGTRQFPSVQEPTLAEAETDGINTAHEHKGPEAKDTPAPPSRSKRRILFAVIGVVLLAATVVGMRYWLHSRHYESTDDAFIEGHATQVSPKVSGYVQKIYITDNQQVRAGDLLVEIDPRDYESRLAQARASLNAAIARRTAAHAGLALTRVTAGAGVEQASAGVEAAHSSVAQARSAAAAADGHVGQLTAAVNTAQANVE